MRKIIIPRGHIWLKEALQGFGGIYIEIKRVAGTLRDNYDGWQDDCFSEAADRLQIALVNRDIDAFYFGSEDIERVPRAFWSREASEEVIRSGLYAPENTDELPVFVEFVKLQRYIADYQERAKSYSGKNGDFSSLDANMYITPFISIMVAAIAHFNISEHSAPKISTIKDWLREQKLPDGRFLSDNQIGLMATFCRPPERMIGGNTKLKRSPVGRG